MSSHAIGRAAALAVALITILAAIAVPTASAAVELKLSAPKGADALLEELTLKATCDQPCTIGLNRVQVTNFKGRQQLPIVAEEPLKGTKKLKAGKPARFEVPLGPQVRSQIQGAVAQKQTALVQVVTDVNGVEGAYRSAAVRAKGTPKSAFAQDDILVPIKPKLRSGGPRYRVTVKGVQTTTWQYNRSEGDPNGCHSWARGDGKQTISFRSMKPMVVRYRNRVRPLKTKAEPELVSAAGDMVWLPLRLDITRTGKRDHGASPQCGGGGGHCPDCGGGDDPQRQCTTKGSRTGFNVSLMLSDRRYLWTVPSSFDRRHFAPGQMPDCPIEPFKTADGDVDLLFARHGFGNPAAQGGGKKVIVILRNKVTDRLDEGPGSTTTSVRWTVTFVRS